MKYTEVDILKFVDGRLNDSQTAEFLAALRTDPELARSVTAMQDSQLPIRQAYEQNPFPPVPDSLRVSVDELVLKTDADQPNLNSVRSNRRFDMATGIGIAASLLVGICVGTWFSQIYLQRHSANSDLTVTPLGAESALSVHGRLVERIVDYQSLYVENTVESLAKTRIEDAQQLLESMRQRTGAHFSIPDYSSYGYEFARAQELGFEGQMLVQLVYRKPGSLPLALCFMPSDNTPPKPLAMFEQNQLHSASWIANSGHYVLVAGENNETLQKMYEFTLN